MSPDPNTFAWNGMKACALSTMGRCASGKICAPVGVEADSICVRHVATDESRANLLPTALAIGPRQPVPKGCR